MRTILWAFFLLNSLLNATIYDAGDVKKRDVLRHFDIPISFLNDLYLQDMISEKKRETDLNGISASFENASIFIPTLSSLIAQSDLPNEFLFVVLVESKFDPLSTSSRGASGLWQFMEGTGKLQGLAINRYVDERRDYIKSTRAAITYLSQLHKQFGKWYLALIAYNCGDGRLSRAIQKAGTTDLDVLADPTKGYIPPESRRYIRKVLAISLLATDDTFLSAIQYDKWATTSPDKQIATVYLPEGEDIDRIAAVLEMPKNNLKRLNTHLKKGVTPPSASAYPVYIPQDKLEAFQQKYRPRGLKGYFLMHKMASGETLNNLSKRYNVSKGSIMDENMMVDENDLSPNRNIKIPVRKPFIKSTQFHTAKPGETLASVATLYNLSLEQLRVRNPFVTNVLKEGEEVKVGD